MDKIWHRRRPLADVAGMKKLNDHAESTAKKNTQKLPLQINDHRFRKCEMMLYRQLTLIIGKT